jgi:hypothetical protein
MSSCLELDSTPLVACADNGTNCPVATSPKPLSIVPAGWGDKPAGTISYINSNGACGTVSTPTCNPATTALALTHTWKPLHYGMGLYLLYDPGNATASGTFPAGPYCSLYNLKVSVTVV